MAKRGPKAKARDLPRRPLTDEPPGELVGRARALYRSLARQLIAEGYACSVDSRTVALAARAEAHHEQLTALLDIRIEAGELGTREAAQLESRLGKLEDRLGRLYGQLLMTPRARSSSRLAAGDRQAGAEQEDDFEAFARRRK